jgi:hypothetical protein
MNKHVYNNIDEDITLDFNKIRTFDKYEAQDIKDDLDINDLLKQRYNISTQPNKNILCPLPSHNEKTPSFHTISDKSFKCHGCGEGGDIFKLIMAIENVSFIEAKQIAKSCISNSSPTIYSDFNYNYKLNNEVSRSNDIKSTQLEIKRVEPLHSYAIEKYLISRGINNYSDLQEVHYMNKGRVWKGLTWENISNGREISFGTKKGNFKSTHGKKDITYIKAKKVKADTVLVFEGYFDYLSYREMNFKKSQQLDICILNSVNKVDSLINYLSKRIKKIGLALDNDKAGDRATEKIQDHYRDTKIKVTDHRHTYKKYNDLNDRLLKKKMSKKDYLKRKDISK